MSNTQKEQLTEFEELVQADIRNEATDEEAEILRDPENAQEWYNVLLGIIRRIDVQMTNAKAERLRMREEYDRAVARKQEWRASALGFRALAEKKLAEAKAVLGEDRIEIIRLNTLEDAIKHHREVVEGDQPEAIAQQADQNLWATIEG